MTIAEAYAAGREAAAVDVEREARAYDEQFPTSAAAGVLYRAAELIRARSSEESPHQSTA
jgi:hypothetical protein